MIGIKKKKQTNTKEVQQIFLSTRLKNKNKLFFTLLFLIITTSIFLLSVLVTLSMVPDAHGTSHSSSGTIQIGVLYPQTGDLASLGAQVKAAMDASVSAFNADDDSNSFDLELVYLDTETSPATTQTKIEELHDAGHNLILGPTTSANLAEVDEFANNNDLLLFSCCSSADSLSSEDNVFRLVPTNSKHAAEIVRQIDSAGIDVVIPIYRNDEWGKNLESDVRRAISQTDGLNIETSVSYFPDITNYNFIVNLLKTHVESAIDNHGDDKNYAVLLISFEESADILSVASTVSLLYDVRWFGVDVHQSVVENSQARAFAQSVNYTSVLFGPDREHDDFATVTANILSRLGTTQRDLSVYAYSAYDTVQILGRAIQSAAQSTGTDNVKAALPGAVSDYDGLLGAGASLDANGDLVSASSEKFYVDPCSDLWSLGMPSSASVDCIRLGSSILTIESDNVYEEDENTLHRSWFGKSGDAVTITVKTTKTINTPQLSDVTVEGFNLGDTPALDGEIREFDNDDDFEIRFTVDDGTLLSDGPISFSIDIEDSAGNTATLSDGQITDGSTASVDNTPPSATSAQIMSADTVAVYFNEPVHRVDTADFANVSINLDGTPTAYSVTDISGSGASRLLTLDNDGDNDIAIGDTGTMDVIADRFKDLVLHDNTGTTGLAIAAGSASISVTDDVPVPLVYNSFTDTIFGNELELDLNALPPNDFGFGTQFPPKPITVHTRTTSVTFPADLVMVSDPPTGYEDRGKIIKVSVSTNTVDPSVISGDAGVIIELGSPSYEIFFNLPVRVVIPDKAGDQAFYISPMLETVPITTVCDADDIATVTSQLIDFLPGDPVPPDNCAIDVGSDKVIYTVHFTGFGAAAASVTATFDDGGDRRGGDDCDDCEAPTFGKNRAGAQLVTGGFAYNNAAPVDVTDYHTEFPLITVITNATNTASVKIYENHGINSIALVQFGLGMPEVGAPLGDAQTLVEISLDEGMIDEITLVDSNNLVDIVDVTTDTVSCAPGASYDCLEVTMQYVYRDQPKYNVMGISAADMHRNMQINYLNDGVLVTGESMNELLVQDVAVSKTYSSVYPQKSGIVELTLVDYKTDLWQDEYGYMWSTNQYGPYMVDSIPLPTKDPDVYSHWSGYNDRMHSEFADYKDSQIDAAVQHMLEIYHNSEISTTKPEFVLKKSVSLEAGNNNKTECKSLQRDHCMFADLIDYEIERANKTLEQMKRMSDPIYYYESQLNPFPTDVIDDYSYSYINHHNNLLGISGKIQHMTFESPLVVEISYPDGTVRSLEVSLYGDGSFETIVLSPKYDSISLYYNGILIDAY